MMKKAWTTATAFAVALALLTGCGGGSASSAQSAGEDTKQETAQAAAQETVQEAVPETEPETAQGTEQAAAAVPETASEEPVEIQVFIAASLNTVMQDVKAAYEADHPNVTVVLNASPRSKRVTSATSSSPPRKSRWIHCRIQTRWS